MNHSKCTIKRSIASILLIAMSTVAFSQFNDVDFGATIGTMQYNGDVNMTSAYHNPSFMIGAIFRKNYNPHYSHRFNFTFGGLAAADSSFSESNYQRNRDYSFNLSPVLEFSTMVEFNFYEVTNNKKEKNFSPYVVFGLGLMYFEDCKFRDMINIPMGLGLKYKLMPRIELRAEWAFRKTFTDKLDCLSHKAKDGYLRYKQTAFSQTNDWFSVLGISLLFNFSDEKIPCPVYDYLRKYDGTKKHKR